MADFEYTVLSPGQDPPESGVGLYLGSRLPTGEDTFAERFGGISSLESDLLRIAAAAFAADRGSVRGEREDLARRLFLSIPVVNAGRLAPLMNDLQRVLRLLSNDVWRITLRQVEGKPEGAREWPDEEGKTLLFSGGLDSLAAAVMYAAEGERPQLVSHVTHNLQTRRAQEALVRGLKDAGHDLPHTAFFVSSRSDEDQDFEHSGETSQRTRSFVFITLGSLVARRTGQLELVVLAENGQMAIHLPLSHGRIGAFSTHTAHPDVLVGFQAFFSTALDIELEVSNPFVNKTKAEVVAQTVRDFPELVALSESCWKNARTGGHCGECIPCYVRRIALERHGVDPTLYAVDPWAATNIDSPVDDTGRRNLVDLVEFVDRFRTAGPDDLMSEWPELYSPNIDAGRTISMYQRFAQDAWEVFQSYPAVLELTP